MNKNIETVCFNTKETAKYTGLGITKTQEYIREGIIPSIKLGRRYIVPKAVLDKWLEEQSLKKE
jgi:excisionase family DNA binding protein